MKKIITLFFILYGLYAFSQQEAQFTHNMFNQPFYNPASNGVNNMITLTALARQQWLGFKDEEGNNVSPQTFLFSAEVPIKKLRGGVGLSVYKDKLGFEDNIGVKLGYAFRFNLGPGSFGIGLSLSLLNKYQDFSKLTFSDINNYDPLVQNNKDKQSMFLTDIAGGLYYNIPEKMYAGISATQLIQTDQKYSNLSNMKLKRHYYITGGYFYEFNSSPFVLNPNLLIKTDFVSAQYELEALLIYNQKFWGGLGYRFQDAVMLLLGVNIKGIMIGYSYGFTTSAIRKSSPYGDHELMLRYAFKLETKRVTKTYKNARYL